MDESTFSAQRKHFWRKMLGGVSLSVIKMAQVELKSRRVKAPTSLAAAAAPE